MNIDPDLLEAARHVARYNKIQKHDIYQHQLDLYVKSAVKCNRGQESIKRHLDKLHLFNLAIGSGIKTSEYQLGRWLASRLNDLGGPKPPDQTSRSTTCIRSAQHLANFAFQLDIELIIISTRKAPIRINPEARQQSRTTVGLLHLHDSMGEIDRFECLVLDVQRRMPKVHYI
jgi:hypothetical protein